MEQWPPRHLMRFGFPCDKPLDYIVTRAKLLGSKRKDWEEIAAQEEVNWTNFFVGCIDVMNDVIYAKCLFPGPMMTISTRAGMKKDTVGLLTIFSNTGEKFVELPEHALRAVRWAFQLPADARPMWYYSQEYYWHVVNHLTTEQVGVGGA
ncbi:hypothetical protein TRAPUB_13087 [Trametes pubescens]|uniref:Uncharacterized protein n=1 Tax=Trametes pubescens TaxID=154538 RepID=A0A1M2VS25_TRAPU|nr:hypothetical protein TRAPUB_13087 [Trametes pubescens]